MNIEIVDPGHTYRLPWFDRTMTYAEKVLQFQILQFLKREGEGYPGNVGHHPGTNLQSVFRACIDRVTYLQGQIPCQENLAIINNTRDSLFLLEHRAMRRHGMDASTLTQDEASNAPMCAVCGHVRCDHEH